MNSVNGPDYTIGTNLALSGVVEAMGEGATPSCTSYGVWQCLRPSVKGKEGSASYNVDAVQGEFFQIAK